MLANIVMPGIADKSGKIINHCTLLVAMDTKYRADQVETANAGVISAKATLEDFSKFDRFNYPQKKQPLQLKLRKNFPLLSSMQLSLIAFLKVLFTEGAWKEGKTALKVAISNFFYYIYVGYYIYLLKKGKTIGEEILLEKLTN